MIDYKPCLFLLLIVLLGGCDKFYRDNSFELTPPHIRVDIRKPGIALFSFNQMKLPFPDKKTGIRELITYDVYNESSTIIDSLDYVIQIFDGKDRSLGNLIFNQQRKLQMIDTSAIDTLLKSSFPVLQSNAIDLLITRFNSTTEISGVYAGKAVAFRDTSSHFLICQLVINYENQGRFLFNSDSISSIEGIFVDESFRGTAFTSKGDVLPSQIESDSLSIINSIFKASFILGNKMTFDSIDLHLTRI